MFKIESYITSIILANADRYIRNFRRQDAQVSLWEGDATFHNIDLNVEALNEEFQSPFVVISSYIHDLTIHVPWTKLMSESVTISVNTIECVMRLKSKKEKLRTFQNTKTKNKEECAVQDPSPQSSYTSTITNKIMNNLSICCENVILKIVEEDTVFSMNIEKLKFDNVNEFWVPTMTDFNTDKLQTRKLITLSGLTICLDKQNSAGRIDTYMEPLLYRCLIHIRLLRGYHRAFSKRPVYSHFDILSSKMSFTISEPQVPMLLRLATIILDNGDEHMHNHRDSTLSTGDGSTFNISIDNISEEEGNLSADEASWGYWLWSIIPTIFPQDEDNLPSEEEINPTYHVGFCIEHLELNIKVWNSLSKIQTKHEFKTILESKFDGCFYQMTMRNTEWLNLRFGVNYVCVETSADGTESRVKQVLCSGVENKGNFPSHTLFDDTYDFYYIKQHQKKSDTCDNEDGFDFMYNLEFSTNTHLNYFTENMLLEETSAFSIDYVKDCGRGTTLSMKPDANDGNSDGSYDTESETEKTKSSALLRFVFGSISIKVTSDFINRVIYLRKIISSSDMSSYRQTISGGVHQKFDCKSTHKTRFTLFDLNLEFHVPSLGSLTPSSSKKDSKFSDIPESFSSYHSTPILHFFCKCIDGEISNVKNQKIITIKTAELIWSLIQSNHMHSLFRCDKLDCKSATNSKNQFFDLRVDLKHVLFKSSKPNMLMAYYIINYLLYTSRQSDERNYYYTKIFFSSLFSDTLLPDNTVLEVSAEVLQCTLQSLEKTSAFGVLVNGCKAHACKVTDDDPKRILICSFAESESQHKPIKLQVQHGGFYNEESNHPSYIQFSIANIKVNLDPILYSWLTYKAIPNVLPKPISKMNKPIRDYVIPKSIPSRKVSDGSSGSHGRKYGSAYPKPKESVHSSGDPETHSPTEVTETEPSDIFQVTDVVSLPKPKLSLIQYVASKLHTWCKYVVHGDISDITVYFPTFYTTPTNHDNCKLEQSLIETMRKRQDSKDGVFVLFLKSMKLKCDFPTDVFEKLNSDVLLSVSKDVWPDGKLTSPWNLSINDIHVTTLSEGQVCHSLLKPFSSNCTIGVSFRSNATNGTVPALCVHFDFQPLFIDLVKNQCLLISSAVDMLNDLCKTSVPNTSVVNEQCARSPTTSLVEAGSVRKLTGWIQWTFTKCCLNIYHENGKEVAKLSVEAEDSIVSLEFDDVFHKLKVKLTSFNIYHRVMCTDSHSWQDGPFCGAIIQRCYPKPCGIVETVENDIDDRFLLATITRARSSNLSSRLNTCSDIQISSSSDHYVTEIILDVCSVDAIIPFSIMNKFLSMLTPLISRPETASSSNQGKNESDFYTCLPLTYFSIPLLRIFMPISEHSTVNLRSPFDTIMCELHRVSIDCHPKNLIIRRQTHSKFFQSTSGKRYSGAEVNLQGQQYQMFSKSVSVKTGKWFEIEQIIFKEQLSMKEPPTVLEQNPAVMWNQGYHPEDDKTDQNYLSNVIANFSCHIQLAPSIKCYSLKTIVQGPQLEVNILTDLEITISIPQICFLLALYNEYACLILPLFMNEEKETSISPAYSEHFCRTRTSMRTTDSGIESVEQNSVASSTFSKSRSEIQTANVRQSNLKSTNISTSLSNMSNVYKCASVTKKIFFEEVFVTARRINFIFYKIVNAEEAESCSPFSGLFFCEVVQPSLWLTNENNYPGVQMEIFDVSVRILDPSLYDVPMVSIPNRTDFSVKILEARKFNREPYSKITNAWFNLKMLQNARKKWKVDCVLRQPLFVNCEIQTIQYVLSMTTLCYTDYQKYVQVFDVRTQSAQTTGDPNCNEGNKLLNRFSLFSSLDVKTSRFVLVLKSKNTDEVLLLNADAIDVHVNPPGELKTQSESISVQCEVHSIAVSLPQIHSKCLSDILSKDEHATAQMKRQDFFSNLVLRPWNVKSEFTLAWHRWNLFLDRPWACLKIDSENISFNLSPAYIEKLTRIVSTYGDEYRNRYAQSEKVEISDEMIESDCGEFYKDDLRAGAFQYIKINEDKCDSPSPYEVYFCNRRVHPFMCWRYPQPRNLTKLQIYPILVEDANDEFVENKIRCQLQYYNEITKSYQAYVTFNLCDNSIQNITLPSEKPRIVAAECWRIVLFDFVDSHDNYDIKMDIKSLVGYVRVDSVFRPSYVPELQLLLNISEVQFHLYASCRNENIIVDNYFMDYFPSEQCFLCAACSNMEILISDFKTEKIIKLYGIGKANILNYEYLMMQSLVDPFTFEALLYHMTDSYYKLAATIKTIHVRVSPQFVHTLSVMQTLWDGWKADDVLPWKVTAPYIISNNTNQLIMFRQESTSREIYLSPCWCHLFAWCSPTVPKLLKLSVFCGKKQFISEPFGIEDSGFGNILCKSEEGESCMLNISVVEHSSVVRQVIIRGTLLAYNMSQSEIDICVISHGKKVKNKLSSAQVVSASSLTKRRLLSLVLPLEHQLVFKIRLSSSQSGGETVQWSGLINLKTCKNSNQTSWLVKVPLKNHKEHFQSVWCQVTFEVDQEFPSYLIVFRSLCSVISFLPWKSYFTIFNELGMAVDSSTSSRGVVTDLRVPDTVSLDKYTIEYKCEENATKCLTKTQLEVTSKNHTSETKIYSIQSLLEDIEASSKDNQWPYLNNAPTNVQWKSVQISEGEPIIKVSREERMGCGTMIELYPWAIITNLLDYPIILVSTTTIYTIGTYEVLAPPSIEGTFKIGLVDGGSHHLSGTLQLSDDQSFPIPKVTGRIPMNGFVTTMIDCDDYVSFANITSKSYKDMRIISVCSSYVINNNSSFKMNCSAWVICRSGDKSSTSFDLPLYLESKSICLAAKGNSSAGQAIAKWYKMGTGDVQVLPYLILTMEGSVACPVRICDLSEKQRYPIVFSCVKSSEQHEQLACVFMTAQQCDGQVFLSLWDEKVPQIAIHNMSQLSLNVIASRNETGNGAISCCIDWNWKFKVSAKRSAYFHTQYQTLEEPKKQFNEYLMFAVENKKHVKHMKWSSGVPLATCVNQLITLPLSQHHIKLAIFRNGFTFVVWIESATADELSAKMIRARLSESFLPINEGAIVPLTNDNSNNSFGMDLEVPEQLRRLYGSSVLKPMAINIFVDELCLTLAEDDESTLDEKDVATFCAKKVFSNVSYLRKPNEVIEDVVCHVSFGHYQLDNDEYGCRAYDFPVVLLSQQVNVDNEDITQHHVEDLLLGAANDTAVALKADIHFSFDKAFRCSVREVELNLSPLNVYLEDKYLSKLKKMAEKLFSAIMNSSTLEVDTCQTDIYDRNVVFPLDVCTNDENKLTCGSTTINAAKLAETPPKAMSSSSKSVNVSECDGEDKNFAAPVSVQSEDRSEESFPQVVDHISVDKKRSSSIENLDDGYNYVVIPESVIKRSRVMAKPIRLRSLHFSPISLTVSVHTSTAFYIALDRSPLKFSEFKKEYLVMTPFELGNGLVLHYFFGAIYGTGWAISSLEFVGSPGVLARNLGTGVKDFVSMPIYGISSGPRGLVLGIAHGSASLMKHIMAGTLSSVTNFAGSWARTLNRFTLDADDLLQSEQIRRFPPSNVTEGILQGLTEFGISLLGGISGIAHHPLQYAASGTGSHNRSLFNSISLGIVGVLTRPLSGAAELVARTGQGIMSHVGWNAIPAVRNGPSSSSNTAGLQICNLKYKWRRDYENVIFSLEAVNAEDIASSVCIILTCSNLYVIEMDNDDRKWAFELRTHVFCGSDNDPTLIRVQKPIFDFEMEEDFSQGRIYKFINETNRCFNIKSCHASENANHLKKMVNAFSFCVNPQMKNFLLNMIEFVKKTDRWKT